MGFDQIWLTPVCPSSSYHKYSVTDYYSIDPQYGSLEDFSALLEDCHGRGIRVLTDMVLNHSSVQHPWFEAASAYLQSLGEDEAPSGEQCPEYTYYNFSGEKLTGYEPLEGTRFYYEARFSPRMPDLNLDNETVRNEIAEILRFWQELGVDGFRLDACTSYYTDDVARNVEFLSFVNETAKEARPDFYIVGEAWANQQVYAQYYGSGVDSFFDFAFAGAEGPIAKAARGKYSAEKLALELQKEQELYESFNQEYVNAPFYTNHDLNRSAGYYPGDDGSEAKLAGGLNLMMSGDAFVYYGEELGMKGSGRDENKRAPMYWSADPEAEGMTDGPPEMEEVSMKYPDAAHQVEDPDSIWQYYRCAVRIRRSFPALAGGRIRVNETLSDENCFAMVKELPETGEAILLLGNLSKEEISLNLAGEETAFRTLAAVLTVTRDPVVLEEETIRLPGMSMAVLVTEKKE